MPQLFGEKVRALRRQRAMTQVGLAQQLGLAAHSHITKLEAGHDAPSLGLALQIATIFGVATDYLLRDSIPVEEVVVITDTPLDALDKFGEKLSILRQSHGLSQVALAHQLGLARRGYISNLETGRKLPSLELIVEIARLFGVTTDHLLRDSPPAAEKGHDP